jgi:hypothetical protein
MPDVYQMKDNNMSSNPDTKNYSTKDIFTYISYTVNKNTGLDTTQFKVSEMAVGDTILYSKGWIILDSVSGNPAHVNFLLLKTKKYFKPILL